MEHPETKQEDRELDKGKKKNHREKGILKEGEQESVCVGFFVCVCERERVCVCVCPRVEERGREKRRERAGAHASA